MIVKSWKFTGFKATFPEWVAENTSKRAGSKHLWVHTQYGEAPAREGEWISINLRGHLDIHSEKPEGWAKEMMAGAAFTVLVFAVFVIFLAM